MSVQTALQFFNSRVATTPSLSRQFLASIAGATEAEAAQVASALGRDHGFVFSVAEATEARRVALARLTPMKTKPGEPAVELNSDELDQVAGGNLDINGPGHHSQLPPPGSSMDTQGAPPPTGQHDSLTPPTGSSSDPTAISATIINLGNQAAQTTSIAVSSVPSLFTAW